MGQDFLDNIHHIETAVSWKLPLPEKCDRNICPFYSTLVKFLCTSAVLRDNVIKL